MIKHLVDHLQSVYADGAWSDVSVRDAFSNLNHEQASARPIPERHTAWEILLHLDAWHRAVARRLAREFVALSSEEDWPRPPESSDRNWADALETLDAGFDVFLRAVNSFPEDALHDILPGGRHSAYETILGIGEHDLYHAGQVTLLSAKR